MDSTPAIWAGTTFMTTLDSNGASPPGTYRPTRRTGTQRSVTVPPGTTCVVTSERRWSAWTRRTRVIASSSAARRDGSHSARARSSASWGTAKFSLSTPSSRAVISRTAWAPRMRTSSHKGRTVAMTESMSVAARGRRSASSRLPGSADPRRSMRASTDASGWPVGGVETCTRSFQGSQRCWVALRPPYAFGMGELIPLFPLGTPLFPGVVLPLQIFEPRYRRLVRDLLALPDADDRRFFGVVAIRQGWEVEHVAPAEALYDVGCTARVQAVRAEPDGGFRIVTVGGERFRLLDVVIGDDPPYLQAEVEWLLDEEHAEEAAGDHDGIVPGGEDPAMEDVVASVARGSMDVLSRNVRDLFTCYVAEVAGLGEDDPDGTEPTIDAETAV